MADVKKKKEARQGLQGHLEAMKEYERKRLGLPEPTEEEEKGKGILETAKDLALKPSTPAELINKVGDYYKRVWEPTVETTGGKLNEAIRQFGEGHVAAGSLNAVNSVLGLVASPFTLGSAVMKEFPVTREAANTLEVPFSAAAEGEQYVEKQLGNVLDKLGVKSDLGLSKDEASEVKTALSEINQFGAQAIVGSLLGTGVKKVTSKLTEVKPINRTLAPEVEVKGELPPSKIDQARMRGETPPPPDNFTGDTYGQNKRSTPEFEREVIQELRTKRDQLEQEKVARTMRLSEINTEIKSLRSDDSFSVNTKKSKIRALRNEALGLQKLLADLDVQLEPINSRLDYFGERVDKWRPEGRLLPEYAGVGSPTDMSGKNVPSNVDFAATGKKSRVFQLTKGGLKKSTVEGLNPEKGVPVEKGSPIDELAGGRLEYAIDVLTNSTKLRDILQRGIQYGQEKLVFNHLIRVARRKGLETEFRNAVFNILKDLYPRKGTPEPGPKTIPSAGTPDATNIAKSDYNARIREYLRGEMRKKGAKENNAVQIKSTNEIPVPKSPENGKGMGEQNTEPEKSAGTLSEKESLAPEKEITENPEKLPTEPQDVRDVPEAGGEKEIKPEEPEEARIKNKEVPKEKKALRILKEDKDNIEREILDISLERLAGRKISHYTKEAQEEAKKLLPEVDELLKEAGLTRKDIKEHMETPLAPPARELLKENLLKDTRAHVINAPVNELPKGLRNKIVENAKNKLSEVERASVESQGATFQRDNVGQGYEVTSATGSYTINSFPEWFRDLGEKRDRVMNALKKIISGEDDKGAVVERMKGIIIDHLTKGESLSELHGNSGRFEKVSRGMAPADKTVARFMQTHGSEPLTRAEMRELYETMKPLSEPPKVEKAQKAEVPKVGKVQNPTLDKLHKSEAHWKARYDFLKDDPFSDPMEILEVKKKIQHIRKRIKSEIASNEAIEDILRRAVKNENKLGSLAGTIDPVILKDYTIVGKNLVERGLDRFTDWSREMVRQFGSEIKPHLRALWSAVARERENEKVKEEAPELVQETRLEIAERVISENLDKAMQEKARRAVEEYLGGHKVMTTNKAHDSMGLLEKAGVLTKRYKKAGGELFQRAIRGDYLREQTLRKVYEDFITPLKDLRDKMDGFEFMQSGRRVIEALEDRAHADKYLKSRTDKDIYDRAVNFFNYFKEELDKAGFKTIEDYFTHILQVNQFENILTNLAEPGKVDYRGLNWFITSDSRFTKVRTRADMPMNLDLVNVMDTYAHSITKALAFKDLVDYYYTDFLKDIPETGGHVDLKLAQNYVNSVISPTISNSKLLKFIEHRRNTVYRALLWNNLKSAVQNGLQKELARLFMTQEAISLTNKAYRQGAPIGGITDAIGEIKREVPYYTELMRPPIKNKGIVRETIQKVGDMDFFQFKEMTNWKYSELGGVINHAVKSKAYKDLVSKGMDKWKAINHVLKDQKTFEGAVREGVDLSARTQISPSSAMRPFFYDHPAARIYAMFTRFKFGQLQILSQTLLKPLEGAEGLRAQTILRRGVFEDVKPVESLYAVEYYRKNLEILERKMGQSKTDIGVERQFVRRYIDYLKGQEKELNAIIKELEPLNGGKGKMAMRWGKYFTKSAAVAFTFSIISNSLSSLIQKSLTGEEPKEKKPLDYAVQVGRDINPVPTTGSMKNPLLPEVDLFLYGNFNGRGATRELLKFAMNVTPGLGVVQRWAKFATGVDIAGEGAEVLFPKKKKQPGRSMGKSMELR